MRCASTLGPRDGGSCRVGDVGIVGGVGVVAVVWCSVAVVFDGIRGWDSSDFDVGVVGVVVWDCVGGNFGGTGCCRGG